MLILAAATAWPQSSSRFRRVVKLHSSDDYINERRDIAVDVKYFNRMMEPKLSLQEDSTTDTITFPRKNADIAISTGSAKTICQNGDVISNSLRIGALVIRDRFGHARHPEDTGPDSMCNGEICFPTSGSSMPTYDVVDTLNWWVGLDGKHDFALRKYASSPRFNVSPHIKLESATNLHAGFRQSENIEPLIPPELTDEKYISRSGWVVGRNMLRASIGIGRHKNVLYIAEAFDLEKILLKSGAVQFELSDSTISRLANHLGRNDSYKVRNHDEYREFKRLMDSVLVQDAAASTRELRNVPPFEVRKLIFRDAPALLTKPTLTAFWEQALTAKLGISTLEYPYAGASDSLLDTIGMERSLDAEFRTGIQLNWGAAISKNWFLTVDIKKAIVSYDDQFTLLSSKKENIYDAIETELDLTSTFWPTPYLMVHLGVEDMLALLVAPIQAPYRSFIELGLFIEEYFTLRLSGSLYASKGNDVDHVISPEIHDRLFHGLAARLIVAYNF